MNKSTNCQEIKNYLERADFFHGFLSDELFWLANKSEKSLFKKDSLVFSAGNEALHLYIICSGSVAINRQEADGRVVEMARYEEGDSVGDFDFSRCAIYDADALCLDDCQIISFPLKNLTMDDISRERPDISARIFHRAVTMISSRIRSTQKLISENAPWVRELREAVYTDSGTGLFTKSYLEEELSKQVGTNGFILCIKPDSFKQLCDTYGHEAGDAGMREIAKILKAEAANFQNAWAIRLRSNETAIIASGASIIEGNLLAERIANSYKGINLEKATNGNGFKLSASLALSFWKNEKVNLHTLTEKTYNLLMTAWNDGGDRLYLL